MQWQPPRFYIFLKRKVSTAKASCIIVVNTQYGCNGDSRRDDHVANSSSAKDDNGDDDGDGAGHENDVHREMRCEYRLMHEARDIRDKTPIGI